MYRGNMILPHISTYPAQVFRECKREFLRVMSSHSRIRSPQRLADNAGCRTFAALRVLLTRRTEILYDYRPVLYRAVVTSLGVTHSLTVHACTRAHAYIYRSPRLRKLREVTRIETLVLLWNMKSATAATGDISNFYSHIPDTFISPAMRFNSFLLSSASLTFVLKLMKYFSFEI